MFEFLGFFLYLLKGVGGSLFLIFYYMMIFYCDLVILCNVRLYGFLYKMIIYEFF